MTSDRSRRRSWPPGRGGSAATHRRSGAADEHAAAPSLGQRCDEIIRLIDDTLGENRNDKPQPRTGRRQGEA